MKCGNCNTENPDGASVCESCGEPLTPEQAMSIAAKWSPLLPSYALGLLVVCLTISAVAGSAGSEFTVIVAGIAAVIGGVVALFTGPAAFFTGIVGILDVRLSRGRKCGQGRAVGGVVIGLLWSLATCGFLYTMAHAHEGGRKASCMNNMKELAKALMMYEDDYDRKLPSSYLYGRNKTWSKDDFSHFALDKGVFPKDEHGETRFSDENDREVSLKTRTTPRPSWPMLLYPYMRNKDIIWCPSDSTDRDKGPVSYWWRAAIDRAWYGGFKSEGDFDFPADQVFLYEHGAWHSGSYPYGLKDEARINCIFLDGHVSQVRLREALPTETPMRPNSHIATRAGEPAWFNYNDATKQHNRGQNWNPRVWRDQFDSVAK